LTAVRPGYLTEIDAIEGRLDLLFFSTALIAIEDREMQKLAELHMHILFVLLKPQCVWHEHCLRQD
jgi:hypothetical protein